MKTGLAYSSVHSLVRSGMRASVARYLGGALVLGGLSALVGCAGSSSGGAEGAGGHPTQLRAPGQSDFASAPPGGKSASNHGGLAGGDSGTGAGTGGGSSTPAASGAGGSSATTKTVEETDIYRVDGDRLYYLNAYRGLMVFDISDVDHPQLVGHSAIYGQPVEMVVHAGIASVVVADWYGSTDDGLPFHGSIVRGLDATDPAHIQVIGEAKLGGWVRDTRVVGDVLYAVSEDYGWYYGYGEGDVAISGGGSQSKVILASVSIAGGTVKQTGYQELSGSGGIFNVTPNSILLAHDIPADATQPYGPSSGTSELQYIDISDPGGAIVMRGTIVVPGSMQAWSADSGRWNLDFADAKTAHTIGCAGGDSYYGSGCNGSGSSLTLATVDFSNPDAPVLASTLPITSSGWSATARFDAGRMYLSPSNDYGYGSGGSSGGTPVQIYDLSDPKAPKLAGSTDVGGQVWLFMPAGDRLFALGNSTWDQNGESVALSMLDVSDAASPKVIGRSTFGDGWAWTPAAGTFKAFTKNDVDGLVALPFSGWSDKTQQYNNGVQLIEFTKSTLSTSGAAKTKGWVERGIFAKNRLLSMSDLALSVVDYSDHASPKVITELTLARNVVAAAPQNGTIAELSTDWWGYDKTSTVLRVLPIERAEDSDQLPALAEVTIAGSDARLFRNGDMAYVVSNVATQTPCPDYGNGPSGICSVWTPQVQVVDLSNGGAKLRGTVPLPADNNPGYGGWYWYDWFDGQSAVQVGSDVLAFRRWSYSYYGDAVGTGGGPAPDVNKNGLFVVDLSNPDAPTVASTPITDDPTSWWGNLKAVGTTLYATHYDWIDAPLPNGTGGTEVRYYLDQIDLSDRAHPVVGARINVPGVLVGASESDPTLLYTVDYRWESEQAVNSIAVVKLSDGKAFLQGTVDVSGWVGNVFVRGTKAYLSSERDWSTADGNYHSRVDLHQVDLGDPTKPVDRVATANGWGWLLGVEGDRAVVTSGWGGQGVDIYRLSDGAAPTFDQYVRTNGWWTEDLSRQGNQLFLSSGYWGAQVVNLQ